MFEGTKSCKLCSTGCPLYSTISNKPNVSNTYTTTRESIHIFDDIIEIRRASYHVVIMTSVEEGTLLKLNGTTSTIMKSHDSYSLLAQQKDTLSSSLL